MGLVTWRFMRIIQKKKAYRYICFGMQSQGNETEVMVCNLCDRVDNGASVTQIKRVISNNVILKEL
jgi:hypothetical protein